MRKFFGLKFISSLYKFIALLTALFALVWAALIMGDAYLTTQTVQVSLRGDWSWPLQAISILIVGGILALTFFVLSEMIDVMLANYEVSREMLDQINKANTLNERLVKSQQRLVKSVRDTDSVAAINEQLAERKTRIRLENEVWGEAD